MSQGVPEYPAPEVSLYFRPEDLTHSELGALALAQEADDDPKHAIHHALLASHLWMTRNLTEEFIKGTIAYDQSGIAVAADTLWQIYLPIFQRVTGPALASSYFRALAQAKAGDVDQALIYALANEHAARMGNYFHETSREAMIQGFNGFVNRKVPARAAAERVMSAYGLTPRQMSGFVALEPQKAVATTLTQDLKMKAKAYISTSIRQRLKVFANQEDHNLEQQANQFAWMWLVDKGKMDPRTEKVWFTAKDERVCPICGPLHGQAVPITEQFVTEEGKFWVPGVHVNCRCWVRTRVPRRVLESVAKADDDWDPREHPRGGNPYNRGQFSRRPRKIVGVKERTTTNQGFDQIMRDLAARTEPISEAAIHVEAPVEAPPAPARLSPPPQAPTRLSTAAPVRLAQPAQIEPETLTPPAVSLTPQSQAVRLREDEVHIGEELHPAHLAPPEPATFAPKRPEKPKRYRETTRVVPLHEPVFALMTPDDMTQFEESGTIHFTHNKRFTPDEIGVVAEAAQLRDNLMSEKFKEITADGDVTMRLTIPDTRFGGYVRVTVTPDKVDELIQTCAAISAGELDEEDIEASVMLDEYDEDDNFKTERRYKAVDVARDLGFGPEDFNVGIVTLDHVHDSPKRGTYNHQSGSKYGFEEYTVSGQYIADTEETTDASSVPGHAIHGNRIPMFFISPFDPEVIQEEIEDDD